MNASEILSVLGGLLNDAAAAFPEELHFRTKCWFENESGTTKYLAYPDLKQPLEAWGELTVYTGDEPDEEDDSETSYDFTAMVAVNANGEIDDGEVEEVKAGIKEEIETFLAGMESAGGFEALLRAKKEAADKAYREQLEKYERSMKQMKRIVYGCAAAAAVIFVLLVLVKAFG